MINIPGAFWSLQSLLFSWALFCSRAVRTPLEVTETQADKFKAEAGSVGSRSRAGHRGDSRGWKQNLRDQASGPDPEGLSPYLCPYLL